MPRRQPRPEPEGPAERTARVVLEGSLGRPLARVPPSPEPGAHSPDYVTVGTGPTAVVEVKELTIEVARELKREVAKRTWFASRTLRLVWNVAIELPTLADGLSPPPRFPDDDPALAAALEEHGFHVVPREQRVREWNAAQEAMRRAEAPQLKGLAADIEADLATLEQAGLRTTRTYWDTEEERLALMRIARRTGGALCMAHDPFDGQPGIALALSWGLASTGRANAVIERVAIWLDSGESENMLQSLAGYPADERHGVLVIDPSLEPETHARLERLPERPVPSMPVALPHPLDALWVVVGPLTWRFRAGTWSLIEAGARPTVGAEG